MNQNERTTRDDALTRLSRATEGLTTSQIVMVASWAEMQPRLVVVPAPAPTLDLRRLS